MPDMRDVPFKTFSRGPSEAASGPNEGGTQSFRRFGQTGKDWATAIGDIEAMSVRFKVLVDREFREEAIEIIRQNIIRHIQPGAGNFHGYSVGRLAATIGRWDPSQFVGSESGAADEEIAKQWAEEHVPNDVKDTGEEYTVVEYGAYSSARRYRSSTWAIEVGTFTPYAGLVEDGGSMEIADYGNPNKTITATWEANHMFKRGMFESYSQLRDIIQGKVKAIVNG